MKQAFESKLNILLSKLLNDMGVVSHSEHLGKGRKDILIYHHGIAIVLEGSYDKKDAEKDASWRIEQLAADVAIAIHYPNDFPQSLTEGEIYEQLKESDFSTRVIVPEDISDSLFHVLKENSVIANPIEDWYKTNVHLLANIIQEIAQFIITEKVIQDAEEEVGDLIDDFVEVLSYHNHSEDIAQNLHDELFKLYGFSIGDPVKIKEAIFAQSTLAIFLGSVYYEAIRYAHKLDSLITLMQKSNAQQGLKNACTKILEINYEPIFDLVEPLLKCYPSTVRVDRMFKNLIRLATKIASNKTLLRRDLAGKVYHKVVGDWALKKGLATYFTQVPAAYLLLHLAKPNLGRIADFACGSGTLLVAAYSAMSTNYRLGLLKSGADINPREIEENFHNNFIKNTYAFDVLEYAAQITALNLALHSPETPIQENSSIWTIPLGYRKEDSIVSLGSLEFSRVQKNLGQIFEKTTKRGVQQIIHGEAGELTNLEPFDYIAMNPPFSRTTGRGGKSGGGSFGFLSNDEVRKKVKKDYTELRHLVKENLKEVAYKLLNDTHLQFIIKDNDLKHFKNIWQAGEGLLFIHLADMYLKEGGKLSFVIPRGLLSGVSWFLIRTMLAAKYHINYVIVSYETGSYNFSESTDLSECMIVATKVGFKSQKGDETTDFIMLLEKPRTSLEAIALSNRIGNNDSKFIQAGKSKAFINKVKHDDLVESVDNWGRFTFLPNLNLLNKIKAILDGKIKLGDKEKEIPFTRFNDIIKSIGPDRKRFSDTFEVIDSHVPGSYEMLKGGDESLRVTMSTTSNSHILPLDGKNGDEIFKTLGANLLVPDRIRINTAHVTAMFSSSKLIANIFYAINIKNQTTEKIKALVAWLNSTWGILSLLASRIETEGGYIEIKMSQWRLIPIIDVEQLSDIEINKLSRVYDEFADFEFERIPEQFNTTGGKRFDLDKKMLCAFGMDIEEKDLEDLYNEISESLTQWLG